MLLRVNVVGGNIHQVGLTGRKLEQARAAGAHLSSSLSALSLARNPLGSTGLAHLTAALWGGHSEVAVASGRRRTPQQNSSLQAC